MKKAIYILLFLNLLLLNGAVGYWYYLNFFRKPVPNDAAKNISEAIGFTDECGDECKRYIDEALASRLADITLTVSPSPRPTSTANSNVAVEKVRSVFYVPIPGSGSTLSNSWTDLPGTDFYLAKSDYPGILEVYLEVTLKLVNGNGTAYVRLFDATNGIAVTGSEVSTSSQTPKFVSSGKIYLWEGSNLYRIQAKSLTADTTSYEGGRLKIVTEN